MIAPALLPLLIPSAAHPPAQDPVAELCGAFEGYDQNGDGVVEISTVEPLFASGDRGSRVLVLVEARLASAAADGEDLLLRLERLTGDLGSEGYRAHALAVRLGESETHQDGRYVLALRELLRAFARDDALAGVLLFGHFPDAFLVRTVNWRRRRDVTLRKGREDQASYPAAWHVRRVPEDVAHRADIVLSDLDGRWEDVYVQPRTRLATITAVYEGRVPLHGGPCVDLARGSVVFEDFFHVSDGKLEVLETLDEGDVADTVGYALFLDDTSAGHECSPGDRARPNPLSLPDVLVSRIDARGTALRPRAEIAGVSGERLLDAQGRPQAVEFGSREAVPKWSSVWDPDPALERALLAEYLDRNHAFRTGTAGVAWRASSIACGLGSGFRVVSRAADDWEDGDPEQADVHGNPTLRDLASWLAYPAVLRTLRAHSDSWGSVFQRGGLDALTDLLPGPAWTWTRRDTRLEPSLSAACSGGKLDWFLLRTLWEYDEVASEPAFYLHTGCHAISPPGARRLAYDHPAYGQRQGAEALLFFGNGLALMGRSKVFYDEPAHFAESLGAGSTFGAAWAQYFEVESQAASWSKAGGDIGRKRAYFWSVLGDWTLRLSMAAPVR